MELNKGIIQGDSLAMYKEGMHSDAFVEEYNFTQINL